VSCIRSAPSQLVEARSDDDAEEGGRYWREVIPSLGGEGREMASGRGCAMVGGGCWGWGWGLVAVGGWWLEVGGGVVLVGIAFCFYLRLCCVV